MFRLIKVSKTKAEGEHLYINIHGFKDEIEWDILFKKINNVVSEQNSKMRVF